MEELDEHNLPRSLAERVLRRPLQRGVTLPSGAQFLSPGVARLVDWVVWANCDMQMACYGAHIEAQLGVIDNGDGWTLNMATGKREMHRMVYGTNGGRHRSPTYNEQVEVNLP